MSKWINKRRQALDEKINKGTDKTEFDPSFVEMERQTDYTQKTVDRIVKAIPNYLHPNPAARTMKTVGTAMAKFTKTAAEKRYPHAVGEMGEIFVKGANELDSDSLFGQSLRETGEALNQICENQHAYDAEVSQNFIEPLKQLLEKDIAEILHHRKKLEGRRLDFDFKRRKMPTSGGKITDADLRVAEQKLDESKGYYETGMLHLLDNDVEHVSQVAAFVEASISFHRTSAELLQATLDSLKAKIDAAGDRPKREASAAVHHKYDSDDEDDHKPAAIAASAAGKFAAAGAAAKAPAAKAPHAKALFDFEAENEGELSFKEGQTVKLVSRLDENWLEGEVGGKKGIFPSNYVEVIVDV